MVTNQPNQQTTHIVQKTRSLRDSLAKRITSSDHQGAQEDFFSQTFMQLNFTYILSICECLEAKQVPSQQSSLSDINNIQ